VSLRKTRDVSYVTVRAQSADGVQGIIDFVNAQKSGRLQGLRAVRETAFSETTESVRSGLRIVTVVLSGIVFIVASLGALNVLLQGVFRRRRHMAMFRAMGFTPRQIMTGFLVEGIVITAIGSLVGALAAFSLSGMPFVVASMYRPGVTVFTLHYTAGSVIAAVLIGSVVGALCSMVPAWYSGHFQVKDELRAE